MGDKIRVGPYRLPRDLAVGKGVRGDLVRRFKRYLRATPEYPKAVDPDESVRRVAPKTEVKGESSGGRRFSGDLDDD